MTFLGLNDDKYIIFTQKEGLLYSDLKIIFNGYTINVHKKILSNYGSKFFDRPSVALMDLENTEGIRDVIKKKSFTMH